MVVLVRRRSGRVRSPDEDAGGVARGQGIEADKRGAVHVLECDVPGLVADRVRVDLGRAEPVEEAQWEGVGKERKGSGVVRVQHGLWPSRLVDAPESLGDFLNRSFPGDRLELALALGPQPAKWPRQPRSGIQERAVVPDRALAAELAAGHRMIRVTAHVADRPVALDHRDPAGVVTVPGTGRKNNLIYLNRHERLPLAHDLAERGGVSGGTFQTSAPSALRQRASATPRSP